MTEVERRLRENYPGILMMIVSLFVALVFENLVERMANRPEVLRLTGENLFFFAQCLYIAVMAIYYWFNISLHSSSIRGVFQPRDALVPLPPAIAFLVLASTVGTEATGVWIAFAAALAATAWLAFRELGRHYADDPQVLGGTGTHNPSGAIHLAATLVLMTYLASTTVVATGPATGAAATVVALGCVVVGQAVWYREWKAAVGLPRGESASASGSGV